MKRKKYYYLDPVIIRIPGIKTLFEKSVGKRDARQNQVCSNGEVHTTPFIDAKVNSYNAHIEKLLLKTTNELAPIHFGSSGTGQSSFGHTTYSEKPD